MLINIKHNFVVLLTPKCASNAIEDALLPHSNVTTTGVPKLRHTNYRDYQKYIRPYLADVGSAAPLETICIIRHPLAWLNSHYRFKSRLENKDRLRGGESTSTFGISFQSFIEAYISPDPPAFAQVRSQYDFVKDDQNNVGVDKIFLYENLAGFLDYMGKKVGRRLRVAYRNVSPRYGNQKKGNAWLDYAERKIVTRLGVRWPRGDRDDGCQIPDELMAALRHYIADDFALYEKIKGESVQGP